MKLLPMLNIALAVPTLGLSLAPLTLAQTNVWYREAMTPTYDSVSAMASDSAGNVFQAAFETPNLFGPYGSKVIRRTADGELSWTDSIGAKELAVLTFQAALVVR